MAKVHRRYSTVSCTAFFGFAFGFHGLGCTRLKREAGVEVEVELELV